MVISDTEFLMKQIQLLHGVNISNYCTECDGRPLFDSNINLCQMIAFEHTYHAYENY